MGWVRDFILLGARRNCLSISKQKDPTKKNLSFDSNFEKFSFTPLKIEILI